MLTYYIDNGYLPDINFVPLIPVMTSNTTPYGEASSGTVYQASSDSQFYNKQAYKAFIDDSNESNFWMSENKNNDYLQYKFPTPVRATSVYIKQTKYLTFNRIDTFKIQASNDGTSWIDLTSTITANKNSDYERINISNNNSYIYYRLYVFGGVEYSGTIRVNIGCKYLQFYGKAE